MFFHKRLIPELSLNTKVMSVSKRRQCKQQDAIFWYVIHIRISQQLIRNCMNSVCFCLHVMFTPTVRKMALMLLVTEKYVLSFIHRRKAKGFVHMMYSNSEYADMHLVYGAADGNALAARRRYSELFPRRRLPSHQTFVSVDRRMREYGIRPGPHSGRPLEHAVNVEEHVLDLVDQDPSISTRRISAAVRLPQSTVWRLLRRQQLHPFHLQKVHELTPEDYPRRQQFCQWLQERHLNDPMFIRRILFTDEAMFTRAGVINSHNMHQWAVENPGARIVRGYQHQFSINIWCGIVGNYLLGPHVLPPRLNGHAYCEFLEGELPGLLQDVPLATRATMWFMHDGAPAHYSRNVRAYLNSAYPHRWIGRGGPIAWPARSPDLNPLDFYLWGRLKTLVYSSAVPNREVLQQRIEGGCEIIRGELNGLCNVQRSLMRRARVCLQVQGQHFEHALH